MPQISQLRDLDRLKDIGRYDLPASLVVFLVALPLSLGIAIASGAPVMAGLIAAVVGGIVAGTVGGSPLQVSGPAAGLTVVVAELVNSVGWKVTCLITVGAGILQIIFGLSRIAQSALAIAPVVVHAMLAGIGVTIALQQVHVLLGGTSESSALENLKELPGQLTDVHGAAVLVGAIVIGILLLWQFVLPKLESNTWAARVRKIPGPLVAIVAATAVTMMFSLDAERISLTGNFFDAIALPELPSGNWGAVAMGILTIALIASVESLLSAVAVDKMHTGPRTNFDREMIGQGAANTVSGVLGGLPVTGVIVRSSTNVAAGARTRASAILHGVWVLLFAVVLTAAVEQIPKAALAGLLVVIGIQLVKLAHMRLARTTGDLAVYLVTLVSVVFLNLLEGVAIGLALAIAIVVWRVVRAEMRAEPFGTEGSRQWRVSIHGSLSFLSLPRLNKTLTTVPSGTHVTVSLDTDFLDHAASEMIENWKWAHEATGGSVHIEETGRARLDHAPAAPPKRHTQRSSSLTPWKSKSWQADSWQQGDPQPLTAAVDHYHRHIADDLRPHLESLTTSQNPHSLFLTCADSRIVPNVITASGPGDLFTVRNVGNLVPDSGDPDTSVEASLQFAVEELGVSSVVVCGHSSCGAINALLKTADGGLDDSALGGWLKHGEPSLHAYHSGHPARLSAAAAGFTDADQLAIVNVAMEVAKLEQHPLVAAALADGRIRVSGMFFDIASARVIEITATGIAAEADPAQL